jgi:hypothetical protein
MFFVIGGLTLLSILIFGEKTGGIFFFLCFYYLGALQLRSRLVLNKSWTAQYRKGNYYKKFACLCFAIGTIGILLVLFSQQ